jgi:hypothetical protein
MFLTIFFAVATMADMSDFSNGVDEKQMNRISEVSELTGHSERTLRRWVAKRYLEGARREGASPKSPYVIPGSTVKRLLEETAE